MSEVHSAVIARQLNLLRETVEYRQLLSAVKNVIDVNSTIDSDRMMTDVADTVLRTIATDLSSVSSVNKIIIMHLGVIPKVERGKNAFRGFKTGKGMSRKG